MSAQPFSPAPIVRLENAFRDPFNNAVATARTCYASRVITAADVDRDEQSREQRDRIAQSTYAAGHHTTLQHATFQFVLERVSRHFLWSFLHSHPFYNSEQVSQRYVEVKPGRFSIPPMDEGARAVFERTCAAQMDAYHRLIEILLVDVEREYFRIFPARRKQPGKWSGAIKKRAMEIARYVLPIATHAHLYHTVSGLTLHRYHRLSRQLDCPDETRIVVDKMIDEVRGHDPLFFRDIEDPIPLEDTVEYRYFTGVAGAAPGFDAKGFVDSFDRGLGGYRSRLVDWKQNAEAQLANAVRSVLGITRERLGDSAAIELVLSPKENPYLGEALTLSSTAKLPRALSHAHYTFQKKLSHTADSQDQRHRMVPGSRPVLEAHYVPGRPDAIVPDLIGSNPRARDEFDGILRTTWAAIDALVERGVPLRSAMYLLPNAFPIRFEESGELAHLHHKWTTRLCYLAQEEIWRCSVEEVLQVREVHPRIGELLLPPCGLRSLAGKRPTCPEGDRFCGVTVWKLDLEDYVRLI
jgi:thymidylate synthase ThyX